jgi:hypothetical protein
MDGTPLTDAVLKNAASHPLDLPGKRMLIAPAPELLDLARRLERDRSQLIAALRFLLDTEPMDDDEPQLIEARKQSRALLARLEKE